MAMQQADRQTDRKEGRKEERSCKFAAREHRIHIMGKMGNECLQFVCAGRIVVVVVMEIKVKLLLCV